MMNSIYKQQYHLMPRDETCLGCRERIIGPVIVGTGDTRGNDMVRNQMLPVTAEGRNTFGLLIFHGLVPVGFLHDDTRSSKNPLSYQNRRMWLLPYTSPDRYKYTYLNGLEGRLSGISQTINSRIRQAFNKT